MKILNVGKSIITKIMLTFLSYVLYYKQLICKLG